MQPFNPPQRTLMGPGPSEVHQNVYQALSKPTIGHLDPEFLRLMNEVQVMLRAVFQTKNQLTIPVSGTGSAGMETLFVNFLEPGDKVVVCVNGVFGTRMADVAARCGATVVEVKAEWGTAINPADIEVALTQHPDTKLLAIVHAETSTGVLQPMDEVAELAKKHDVLLLLDAVTSLAGVPVELDQWGVDGCYSGTQKCLSCPPGLAPISVSDRGLQLIRNRTTKPQSWYLDLSMVANYWTVGNRAYHHTAPINMNYALHQALRLVLDEGLEARFKRHCENSEYLWQELEKLGLERFVDASIALPQLNVVKVPKGVDEAGVRARLLNEFGIEIGAGLGPMAGEIWRIGLMGESSRPSIIDQLIVALKQVL
ncbi:MAG: alanine--glyoxylate aminotransferase family protein [Xanthomonadales bacterium]|nr:alanine--glyoxylate aminotransferase family protein [Xanthomonadales bacterium]